MATQWDKEFDIVCGAVVVGRESEPLEDSGLWDIVHGPKDAPREPPLSPCRTRGKRDSFQYEI